jgi:hypothetical protein
MFTQQLFVPRVLPSNMHRGENMCIFCSSHYRNRVLYRVYKTLGKALPSVTLDKYFLGTGFFAEYFFSNTRQRLCRVSKNIRQIENRKN